MIFITLPLFYFNYKFNNYLSILLKEHKDFFRIKNLIITSQNGSFPFAIFNGGINLNLNNNIFDTNDRIQNFIINKKNIIPFRFNCSNILLNENDLNDIYENIILNYGNDSGNFIEVGDLKTYNYIINKFPNYEFIFSKNSDYINNLTPEIINTILNQNLFYLLEIPDSQKNNKEFLLKINQKNKIEITIGNRCKCNNISTCALQEQEHILNFSNNTLFYNCKKMNNYLNKDELIKDIDFYSSLGINHFKIDTPPIFDNDLFKKYLIKNLISEEYQLEVFKGVQEYEQKY